MNKKVWFRLGLILLFPIVLFLFNASESMSAPKDKVTKWQGQQIFLTKMPAYGPFGPGETGVHAEIIEWTEWVKKATGGRLLIEWAEPGSIFPTFEADKAIGKGVIPISISYGGYYRGRMPEADIENGLVFAWPTVASEYECLYKYGLYKEIKKVYAERNINWFPMHSDAIIGIGTSFPAPNSASIKGKKIRALGLWGDYISMLGGSPVSIPWGEIYMGMKLGTIDGWMAGAAALEEVKLKEVTKGYVYIPRVQTALCNILINMDAFKALPKDIQEILESSHRYIMYTLSYKWQQQCQWVLANSQAKYGMTPYAWSEEDSRNVVKNAVKTLYPKVAAKSPRCAKMIDIIKKQMRDYGRID